MKHNEYIYKFYLNATHSIYINNILGQSHPHTWEIELDTIKIIEGFVQFNEVEKTVEKILEPYQDEYLNDREPFQILNPTLENIGIYLKDVIQDKLMEMGWLLLSLKISESPARSYFIDLLLEDETLIENDSDKKSGYDIKKSSNNKSLEELAAEVLSTIMNEE